MQLRHGFRLTALAIALSLQAVPAAADKREDTRFGELVKEATAAYGAGKLEESVALLEQAYAIKEDPRLLYNIAKAQEGLGLWQEARDGYRAYLEKDPKAANRDVVQGRIAVLEKQIAESQHQAATAERLAADQAETDGKRQEAIAKYRRYLELLPDAADRKQVEAKIAELKKPARAKPVTRNATDSGSRGGSIAPWIVVGAGGAVAGTGAVFAILSRGKYDDARSANSGQAADDARKSGDTFTTVGNVAMIAGGVVVAGGLSWVLLGGNSRSREPAALELTVSPTQLSVGGSL